MGKSFGPHQERAIELDCRVATTDFEGPLDLLLHLIKTHELSIVDLPLSKVTQQYLLYLDYMRTLNLDIASEYLVMAATLTYLKSRVIVPDEKKEESTGPDPRAKLIRQLLELKCYKELAAHLEERPRLFRDQFLCKNTGYQDLEEEKEPMVSLTNPFQMIESFRELSEKRKKVEHKVFEDKVPVAECIEKIFGRLENEERFRFNTLLPQPVKPTVLISHFLGLLEMTKLQITGFEQESSFQPIEVYRRVEVDRLKELQSGQVELGWD